MKIPVKVLRSPVITTTGYYRWWFKASAAQMLLQQTELPEIDFDKLNKRIDESNNEIYYALYVGISKNMLDRIRWHVEQKHTNANAKNGTLSTLRQTLSALLGIDMTKSEQDINNFIDDNCIWEWEYSKDISCAQKWEKAELSNKNYWYPLNINENKSLLADKRFIQKLKELRKKYRK